MFSTQTYIRRRQELQHQLGSGIALFLGNDESPMNYRDNTYPFRQDSSFLYYWGLNTPGLAAILDVDNNRSVIYGDEATIDDIIWMGAQTPLTERAEAAGVTVTRPKATLKDALSRAIKEQRHIHILPQYRAHTQNKLEALLDLQAGSAGNFVSMPFTRTVIAQRSRKETQEVDQIEEALRISYVMHVLGMQRARTGKYERTLAGAIEGTAIAEGGRLAFPIIFSRHGDVLHNHSYDNMLQDGDLVVHDSGASSLMGYASDITRTIPVNGRFTEQQRAIYELVLNAQQRAIDAIRPSALFKDIHLLAAYSIASDLKALGLMKGSVEEAVATGAHALFFPHGLGHHMGLDVHDLEGLGEDMVGYDDTTQRSSQFGLAYLRLGKKLEPGYVLTVEPGCYFIGPLIDQWQAEGKHAAFINYKALEAWRGFGGVRIEDDVLVTASGCHILGPPIPKAMEDVEVEWLQ